MGIDYHPLPFGLAYATSRLLTDGHDARFVDCIASGISQEALVEMSGEFRPDVVVMETSTPSFGVDVECMRALKTPCIAVGAHATATWKEHLESGFAAVVYGEYDQVIAQALPLEPLPWLALADSPPTEHAPLVSAGELDGIPAPPWDMMPMEKYNDPFCLGRSVTVLSSRGCPFHCSFCTLLPFQGRKNYRHRSAKGVCDEIEDLISRYHPDEFYFDDDTITVNRSHILSLCEEIRRRDFGIPFSCMGNATVARDVLEAMAGAGCRALKFGVESGDPVVLRRIPKEMDLDDVARTVKDCRELGIQTHATFLFGLPGETRESAMRTIDYALALGTHTLQFAIATPYPGTALYERAKAEGWLTKESWLQFDPAGEAVLSYPDYSSKDIEEMHALAWKLWQRHMLTRPSTLLHHFRNAYRREGARGLARLGAYGFSRLVTVLGARR